MLDASFFSVLVEEHERCFTGLGYEPKGTKLAGRPLGGTVNAFLVLSVLCSSCRTLGLTLHVVVSAIDDREMSVLALPADLSVVPISFLDIEAAKAVGG